jgi:hypothetical protein
LEAKLQYKKHGENGIPRTGEAAIDGKQGLVLGGK